ncbi:unnamed protein product [Amoebophrya sp. A25]|nr:unnamed protein product [Amoebophrya sp. A25]|eukprot:GSA25T00027799001.1
MLGSEGFWKRWLTLQTSGTIRPAFPKNATPDRESFSDPAPIAYSATIPVRLNINTDGYSTKKEVDIENSQAKQRDTICTLEKVVYTTKSKPIPACGHCLSAYLSEVRNDISISLPVDIECLP